MRHHSHQVDSEQHLRQEDIQHGIVPHQHLLREVPQAQHFVYLQHSVHIQERRLIKRHRY